MTKLPFLSALCGLTVAAMAADDFVAPHGGPTPAHPATRQYAPDRDAGFVHMSLDITPDFKERTITGEVTFTFNPIAKPLSEMELNAPDTTIVSVESTEKIQAWQVTTDRLIITFASPVPTNHESRVSIRYSAQPEKGLYFRTPEMGYKAGDEHLFTQGEAIDNRYWYPSPDAPNEKFTTEITCHVPDGMTVLSNGRLVSSDKDPAGLTAFHWSQEKPHANYLVSLVAGYFKSVEDKHHDTPLALYVPPSDIQEAASSFRDSSDIMDFYEHDIGVPYPWAKYYQVIVQDFMEGGMENTSLTTLTENTLFTPATENIRDSQGLVAHEMAHQWFGDLVTCKDWSHIWLNEGFATFYALLYDGHKNGPDSMIYGFYRDARRIFMLTNETRAIADRNFEHPDDNFGILAYQKGSWVLRMLRAQLGDDLYRRCIKTYLERHQYGNVVTSDLSGVIEELSGRSYDQFFDQWVYHAHFPEVAAAYSWDEKTKLAKISVQQTQAVNDDVLLFNFPLTVVFNGKSGRVEKSIKVKEPSEDFYFSLPEAPDTVRLDPRLEVLAKISFDVPASMLDSQLADKDDVAGRLLAVAALKDKKDHGSVNKLKTVLNHDSFYGLRLEAASALGSIHSDESLDALLGSQEQSDARVRSAVAAAIAGFYNPTAFKAEMKSIDSEKNPDIQAQAVRGLGNYNKPEAHDLLPPLLKSQSYRNSLAVSAIAAMRAQDDVAYLAPIRQTLEQRRDDFTTRGFTSGLDALAYIARDEDKKDDVREFLSGCVNDKNEMIRIGAIRSLGTLEDARAIPLLETFSRAGKETPEQQAADTALQSIRAARHSGDNLKELRDTVLDLQKELRKLRKEFDAMQDKDKAKPASHTSSKTKSTVKP
jgi:aminopeptidase N